MACPSRWTRSMSHVEAIATPEGNDVVSTFTGFEDELVIAELPAQERTPVGPSAILIAGIPNRAIGADSIHPEPESIVAFSSSVMRLNRSATRFSTGSAAFLYGAFAGTAACSELCAWRCAADSGTNEIRMARQGNTVRRMDWGS